MGMSVCVSVCLSMYLCVCVCGGGQGGVGYNEVGWPPIWTQQEEMGMAE